MKTKILSVMFVLAALTFTSCTKEGPAGPAGTNGTNGTNGNANVTSVTLTPASWTFDLTDSMSYATFTGVSILTSSIASTGAVMVYQSDGSGGWIALPYSYYVGDNVTEHYGFDYQTGMVIIDVSSSDGSDPNPDFDPYKIVCIASSRAVNPDLDLTDYNAVKKAFNLKD